jgi:hypothetical protein
MTSQPPKDTGTTAQDDVSGEARLNYFVYKVGAGNFWLDGWRDLGGLYVGFENTHASADPKKPSIRVRSPEKVFESRTGNDDDNIAWLCHPDNAENARSSGSASWPPRQCLPSMTGRC